MYHTMNSMFLMGFEDRLVRVGYYHRISSSGISVRYTHTHLARWQMNNRSNEHSFSCITLCFFLLSIVHSLAAIKTKRRRSCRSDLLYNAFVTFDIKIHIR